MNLKLIISENKCLFILVILALALGIGNPFYDYPLAYTIGDEFESQRAALVTIATNNPVQQSYNLQLCNWLQVPFIVVIIVMKIYSIFATSYSNRDAASLQFEMFLPFSRILPVLISLLSFIWFCKVEKTLHSRQAGFY